MNQPRPSKTLGVPPGRQRFRKPTMLPEGVPKDVLTVIYALMPGFVAAWIFYGLTAHPQKSPFERTIQALIFTGIVKAVVIPIRELFLWIGSLGVLSFGTWDENGEYVFSFILAIALGLTVSYLANGNLVHSRLELLNITRKTSYPSEWYSTLYQDKRHVYLHLTGQRRIYGWAVEWPDSPTSGHFVLAEPEWILDDNTRVPLLLTYRMLIPATEVIMVETEKNATEWSFDPQIHVDAVSMLVELQKKEKSKDDSEKTDTQSEGAAGLPVI